MKQASVRPGIYGNYPRVRTLTLIFLFAASSLHAENPPPPDLTVGGYVDDIKRGIKAAEDSVISHMVEGGGGVSPKELRYQRTIQALRVQLQELQWRTRPRPKDWEDLPPEIPFEDPRRRQTPHLILLNRGANPPKEALREGNSVFIDGEEYPLREIYRGMADGKPIYAGPEIPFPADPTTVTHYSDGSVTQVTQISAGNIKPYPGHYVDVDPKTGAVRFLVLHGKPKNVIRK